MDADTREAILKSIEHYKRMRDGTASRYERPSGDYCPLCRLCYDKETNLVHCVRCVIYRKTGLQSCEGTPWRDAARAYYRLYYAETFKIDELKEEWKKAANVMILFLESLLTEPADARSPT